MSAAADQTGTPEPDQPESNPGSAGDVAGRADADRPGTNGTRPTGRLVLELPNGRGAKWPEDLADQLAHAGQLELRADRLKANKANRSLFRDLRAAAIRPPLDLRVHSLDPAAEVQPLFEELEVRALEVTLTRRAAGELERANDLARAVGAELRARFVFTPEHWFDFEDVAIECAELDVDLCLALAGGEEQPPLAQLDVFDLEFVKNFFGGYWQRFNSPDRPSSLDNEAFGETMRSLRELLAARLEESTTAHEPLGLPELAHPCWQDPVRCESWTGCIADNGHRSAMRSWLEAVTADDQGQEQLESLPWLRAIAQRFAWQRRDPTLLEALHRLYAPPRRRPRLLEADQEYAETSGRTADGRPWCEVVGLTSSNRKRPFRIGKPSRPRANSSPNVTVLIPSYKHEDYIEETVRSVLAQRKVDFRVVVADDRSPDATVERASAIEDPRLSVAVNEHNLGLGNSVLKALESIHTPYVALLNSDDVFHPDRLAQCLAAFDEAPEAQLVTTGLHLIDSEGGAITGDNASLVLDGRQVFEWVEWYTATAPSTAVPPDDLFAELLSRNFLATSTNFVARTDWLRSQADTLRRLKYCLDWQLFLEAALEGTLHHIPEPLAAYRLHRSNTVWFHDGRRWSYFLEVNRVAATAVRRFAERANQENEAEFIRVLEALTDHLATNGETDGFALFVNTTLDALQLDRLAARSERVEELVQRLNTAAQATQSEPTEDQPSSEDQRRARLAAIGARNARELFEDERDTVQFLRDLSARLERQVSAVTEEREKVEGYYQKARARNVELDERVRSEIEERETIRGRLIEQRERAERQTEETERVRDRLKAQRHDTEAARADLSSTRAELEATRRELQASRNELDAARLQADTVAKLRALVEDELQRTRTERDEARAERDEARGERDEARGDRDEAQDSLGRAREANRNLAESLQQNSSELREREAALASTRQELESSTRDAADLRQQLERERAQVAELQRAKIQLEQRRKQLGQESAKAREELAQLAASREYRTGFAVWNRTGLAYCSRRGKKWYRRLRDAKNRTVMWVSSLFKRRKKAKASSDQVPGTNVQGMAIVAACWQWPIYSHTFVYQEMTGFTHMGLDIKLFHWDLGDTDKLHAAFRPLMDRRVQLEPVWENHTRDMQHYEKTKPGRLRAFLERVSAATGKPVEELEKESIVRQGCTFARMAELADAKYIHSYFFYDQSFMAMQAAWLLDLPRGVSCYADHMMDDYPFKLVPLHVELADVIVATSARIKRELSEISGGKFDDKIIVKPNGVDGQRFPAIERPERAPDADFEVLSVSRIEPKKGLTHLVEAIGQLKQKGLRVVAHIVGSKDEHSKGSLEYYDDFVHCIEQNGVGDQVILHGMMRQEQMTPLIEKSRAFVAPYVETQSGDKDGIPTAMLEALASALPVITTNAGSITEVIDDGVEGIVVGQEDSDAFASALERVIRDQDLEREMSAAARRRFDKDFDINVTEKRLHERVAGFIRDRAKA